MNALSWLIYLADVVNSIGILSSIVGFFALLTFLAGLVVLCANPDPEYDKAEHVASIGLIRWSTTVFIICSLLLIVLPGRDTVYAIAASEMGEEVLNSETGSKAVKALDAWLDRQISPPEEPAT